MRNQPARARRPRHCQSHKYKVRFRTHEDASRALINIRRCGDGEGPVRAYKCPECAGWHLTSLASWAAA